jgi:hypothetical protein
MYKRQGVLYTTLRDKVCQTLVVGTLASSNNKTDCHDISEILLKGALNTKTLNTLTLSKKGGMK